MRDPNLLRTVRLTPYLAGKGPTFTLRLWDTNRTRNGKYALRYELSMRENGSSALLFAGEDFWSSPLHAIDSDATVRSLLTFLTLRPGDTDSDYFENYTAAQLEYCSQHAEALACESMNRFGEDC